MEDRNFSRRILPAFVLLLILAAAFFFIGKRAIGTRDAQVSQVDTSRDLPIASGKQMERMVEPDPVVPATLDTTDEMSADDVLSEPPAVVLEVVEPDVDLPEPQVEPAPIPEPEPVFCIYPGDGFTPTPEGATPQIGVDYEQPVPISGTNYGTLDLPVEADEEGLVQACVVMMYNLSNQGRPIDIEIYDAQPASSAGIAEIREKALATVKAMRFKPARRNNKPVQLNYNVEEVRFGEAL